MEPTKNNQPFKGRSGLHLLLLILYAAVGELVLFFTFFPYPFGRMLIAILFQPLLIVSLLALDFPKLPQPGPEPQENKQLVRVLRRTVFWGRTAYEAMARHPLCCKALVLFGILIPYHLWLRRQRVPFFHHPVSVSIPVVFSVGFFLLLVLDIWCRHLLKNMDDSQDRWGCLLATLGRHIRVNKFLFLGAAVVSAMPMLGLAKFYRQYFRILYGYFAVQTVILAGFLTIRTIKGQLHSHPDLRLLVARRPKGDLELLGYLEANTGITMRSLWSIALIKKLLPYTLFTAVLILWLSTGIVQIAPTQRGALYRLGMLSRESLQPGLHMTLPWPFDRVDVYDTESLKQITVGYTTDEKQADNLWTENHGGEESKLLLGGGNELVSINLRIEYRIDDLHRYLTCSNSPESLLESAAYEVITARTITTNLESLLALDRVAFSESFRQELVQRIARYDTGLEIVDVVIESIHPPVEVAEIYQQTISAGIDAERILLEAQAQAAQVLEEAQIAYDTDINAATAKCHSDIAAAQASVAEFMASVEADSVNYRYFKYLEALQKAYAYPSLIIVGDGVDSSHLYLGNIPS